MKEEYGSVEVAGAGQRFLLSAKKIKKTQKRLSKSEEKDRGKEEKFEKRKKKKR